MRQQRDEPRSPEPAIGPPGRLAPRRARLHSWPHSRARVSHGRPELPPTADGPPYSNAHFESGLPSWPAWVWPLLPREPNPLEPISEAGPSSAREFPRSPPQSRSRRRRLIPSPHASILPAHAIEILSRPVTHRAWMCIGAPGGSPTRSTGGRSFRRRSRKTGPSQLRYPRLRSSSAMSRSNPGST